MSPNPRLASVWLIHHSVHDVEVRHAGLATLDLMDHQWHISWYSPNEQEAAISQIAKLFINGRSQAVRLPAAYRFDTKEVFIRQDPATGDVILSRRPDSWDGFFAALKGDAVPANFLDEQERAGGDQDRDPFAGWRE
jgi:antitoxin VapB